MRHLPETLKVLDEKAFRSFYRLDGQKCWLIRTDVLPGSRLRAYLDAVPKEDYQTTTCLERAEWWKFQMPQSPSVLISLSFKDSFPKAIRNDFAARAVGAVCGIYNVDDAQVWRVVGGLGGIDIRDRIVAHSNGLRKIEINQLNSLLADLL